MDADGAFDERHLRRTAKSCGSDAPTLASSRRKYFRWRRWQTSPVTGKSTKETVKTIARGMPGEIRCAGGDYARMLFYFACEAAGASSARHSLRPLMFQMAGRTAKLGHAPRERGGVCLKHAAPLNLARLAGRGPRRSAATNRGEGDYPQFRACLKVT